MALQFKNNSDQIELHPTPPKRKSKNAPAAHVVQEVSKFTLEELLVYLASQGVFDDVEVPDWATGGTMFEEVFHALRALGDGDWLESYQGYDDGVPGDAETWFSRYCRGHVVPFHGDKSDKVEGDDEDD